MNKEEMQERLRIAEENDRVYRPEGQWVRRHDLERIFCAEWKRKSGQEYRQPNDAQWSDGELENPYSFIDEFEKWWGYEMRKVEKKG